MYVYHENELWKMVSNIRSTSFARLQKSNPRYQCEIIEVGVLFPRRKMVRIMELEDYSVVRNT